MLGFATPTKAAAVPVLKALNAAFGYPRPEALTYSYTRVYPRSTDLFYVIDPADQVAVMGVLDSFGITLTEWEPPFTEN